jgi:hypothetical protein
MLHFKIHSEECRTNRAMTECVHLHGVEKCRLRTVGSERILDIGKEERAAHFMTLVTDTENRYETTLGFACRYIFENVWAEAQL